MRLKHLTAIVCFALPALAHAADDWQTLKKSAQVSRNQVLTGTYLHQMSGVVETFSIVRGTGAEGVIELRQSLDGTPREIVRNGNELIGYGPDKKALMAAKVSAMRLFPALLPDDMAGVAESYTLKRLTGDRVAQRECDWLELKAKDKARYGMRLCLDRTSLLPLKIMTLTPAQEPIEQYMFTEIELVAPKDRSLFKPHYSLSFPIRNASAAASSGTGVEGVEVSGLPSGFRLIRAVQRSLSGQAERLVRHLVYTDGLVMLSLFIEPQAGEQRAERVSTLYGAVGMATTSQGGMQLTLVGDLPEASMLSLLKSIRVVQK
ncbi:MucB/RseB C-terminal domain-containing protein [Pseudogulbenkiania sp. MAI-1]|uniref:MucB/RseB C-terminal domain-containing protein n=1 Tax=Pseudogulbenkiania sp. MAI-1 TaxID=990370 RepID=UPI00045E9184|nr:MucB/RseB C-terminal domain-containing protein [Pseudogulbenkiania sp. MAI-1]